MPKSKLKTIEFSPEMVYMVEKGVKTTAWCLFDKQKITKGDNVELINKQTGKSFAKATITATKEKKFIELTMEDTDNQLDPTSFPEIYNIFSKHYGQAVGPETPLKIVTFKLSK